MYAPDDLMHVCCCSQCDLQCNVTFTQRVAFAWSHRSIYVSRNIGHYATSEKKFDAFFFNFHSQPVMMRTLSQIAHHIPGRSSIIVLRTPVCSARNQLPIFSLLNTFRSKNFFQRYRPTISFHVTINGV